MASKILIKAISVVYLFAILSITFVYGERYNNGYKRGEVHLIPLSSKTYYLNNFWYLNTRESLFLSKEIIGNFLLFVPFYWAVVSLYRKKIHKVHFIVFTTLVILLIESLQYLFSIGTFDIDDIILNVLGSISGYYFYKALYKKI